MPHGAPDFGQYSQNDKLLYQLNLLALMREQGGPINIDGNGMAVHYDDFESGVGAWNISGADGTGVSDRFNGVAYRDTSSLRLLTDNVSGHTAYRKSIIGVPSTNQGWSLGGMIYFAPGNYDIDILVSLYTGTQEGHTNLKFDVNNKTLKIPSYAGGYIAGIDYKIASATLGNWLPFKFVFAPPSSMNLVKVFYGKYGRYCGGTYTSQASNSTYEGLDIELRVTTNENAVHVAYFDSMFINAEEPMLYDVNGGLLWSPYGTCINFGSTPCIIDGWE